MESKFVKISVVIAVYITLMLCCVSCTKSPNSGSDKLWGPISGIRRRASSVNQPSPYPDFVVFEAGERKVLLHEKGISGYVARIWLTLRTKDENYLANVKIRCSFDGETTVDDIPIGMFTGTGPWRVNDLRSAVIDIARSRPVNKDSEGVGRGSFNIGWSMPFCDEVKIEVLNDSEYPVGHFYYIDYIEEELGEKPLLFHADYRIENPTTPAAAKEVNPSAKNNYQFVNIENHQGRYVGTVMAVESHPDGAGKWYEGDDMFFVDGQSWPPRLHGSGTEDYFGMAWGLHRSYQADDHGVTHYERNITDHDRFYDGRFVLYRWHIKDPIVFYKSLHASIEAGNENDCEQHYESVVFWYGKKL